MKAGGEGQPKQEPAPPPPPPPAPPPATAEPAPAPPPKKAPAKVVVKGDSIQIPGAIVFDTGKATFKAGAGSEETLQQLIDYLKKNERVSKLRIEGHTDDVGEDAANLTLSGQRALTIKNFLISKEIKAERLLAVGFGESKPIADNKTDEGRAKNRRSEFKIAGLDGKPYMGQKPDGGGKEFK